MINRIFVIGNARASVIGTQYDLRYTRETLRREENHDHTESQTRGPRAYSGAVCRVHVGPDGPGLGWC